MGFERLMESLNDMRKIRILKGLYNLDKAKNF